ncbi:MAG TPA: cupredoxin family copper-binding protein [Dehalococcoidia bacterium]|nr:cupredoxin family copper-binding protein [Dehalococcoidia bacterium]
MANIQERRLFVRDIQGRDPYRIELTDESGLTGLTGSRFVYPISIHPHLSACYNRTEVTARMSSRSAPAGSAWFVTGIVLLSAALLVGGLAMGIGMADHMGGGMMGEAGNAPQTPFVAQGDATVDMRGFQYFPRDLTIHAGATVTWKNSDNVPHNATEKDKAWETTIINKGGEDSLTFNTAGVFEYYCTIHPSMKAKLTVR